MKKELDCIEDNLVIAEQNIDEKNFNHAIVYHENAIRSLRELDEQKKTQEVMESFLDLKEESQQRVIMRMRGLHE